MPVFSYKFFTVEAVAMVTGRKTRDYHIVSRDRSRLGTIKWYGPWRQFCFFPASDTVWSDGCLRDVQDAMRRLKEKTS